MFEVFPESSKCAEKASVREVSNYLTATPKPWIAGSNPPAPAKLCGQNRSAR